jgi:hypothetical protein
MLLYPNDDTHSVTHSGMEAHMEHYNGEVDNNGNYGVSSDEKVLSSLAYISVLFIVPFLARPDSQYCKFHANQGLVLFLLGNLITLALKVCTVRARIPCMDMGPPVICTYDNRYPQRSTGSCQGTSAHRQHKDTQIGLCAGRVFAILLLGVR